mgnify:CR=1 FL=1
MDDETKSMLQSVRGNPEVMASLIAFPTAYDRELFLSGRQARCVCPVCGGKASVETVSGVARLKCWERGCFSNSDAVDVCMKTRKVGFLQAVREMSAVSYGSVVSVPPRPLRAGGGDAGTANRAAVIGAWKIDHTLLKKALEIRHIMPDALEDFFPGMMDHLGFVEHCNFVSSGNGKGFWRTGVVFQLGTLPPDESSFKIRTVLNPRGDMSFSLPSWMQGYRQLNIGGVRPFGEFLLSGDTHCIAVVEGEFDALTLLQHGIAAVAMGGCSNVTGLLGALDARHVPSDADVLVVMDSDRAGLEAGGVVKNALAVSGRNAAVVPLPCGLPDGCKDVNDMQVMVPDVLDEWIATDLRRKNRSAFSGDAS